MPQVSVIVPVYNTEEFLAECLDSVAGQTLRDIEIVCVDDGSTDASGVMLDERAASDPRFVVVHQRNGGLSAARNAGVAAASGTYLAFLDSDDHLAVDALEQLHRTAVADDLDVLYFGATPFCDEVGMEAECARYESYYRRKHDYPDVLPGGALMARMVDGGDFKPSVCFQLIKTEFYRSAGLSFLEGILHEDNLFSFQCALAARRAGYVAQAHYQRRVRSASIMTAEKGAANYHGFMTSHLEMLRHLMAHDLEDQVARAASKLCVGMYQQALQVYCGLPKAARDALSPADATPEALVAHDVLARHGEQVLKSRDLEGRLKKSTDKLARIERSKSYKMATALRRFARLGRR